MPSACFFIHSKLMHGFWIQRSFPFFMTIASGQRSASKGLLKKKLRWCRDVLLDCSQRSDIEIAQRYSFPLCFPHCRLFFIAETSKQISCEDMTYREGHSEKFLFTAEIKDAVAALCPGFGESVQALSTLQDKATIFGFDAR